MSYCRFRNTYKDLRDCYDHINDDDLSKEEAEAKDELIHLCIDILVDLEYQVEAPG